mgnify:CR=1 FL=1
MPEERKLVSILFADTVGSTALGDEHDAELVRATMARYFERMRAIAERHRLTLLQLSCLWNLSHAPVRSVIPTMIQEVGADAKPIEEKIDDLAATPVLKLNADEMEELRRIGDNTGCMTLKGGNPEHTGEPQPDRWSLTNDLTQVAQRWHIDPASALACTHVKAA